MSKVKALKLLPIVLTFSSVTFADTVTVEQVALPLTIQAKPVQDSILPQLSFKAQQARASKLAQRADYAFEQEQMRQELARKLAEAENKIKQTVGNNQLLLSQTTAKIYLDNDFTKMWNDKDAEKEFLKEYALFVASGVSVKSANALQQILDTPESLSRDILLTDSFLDYLYYNKNVFKNANQWLYRLGSYKTSAPSNEYIAQWINAVNNNVSAQFVMNLVPRNHIYQETVRKLLAISPDTNITNNNVQSVKGKKGKATQSVSESTDNVSFYKLALNAQRLRIIPSFNDGIFVNIPSYQLYYFRDGKLTLQSKVIVGREDRRTPVMYSKLSNVVVNPPWHVPTSIMTKDIVPKLARDPGYADRSSLEILDAKGNKINPRSIKWSQYLNAKSTPYRIRQKAGEDSALGRYKFNMPSSDAIYLHDTPNHNAFSKTNRALSSGCIRVEKSADLATILLKEAGWSNEKHKNVYASKKTTSAQIRSDNPVYLYYVTAWVENGNVYTLPDIYKYDNSIPRIPINWHKVRDII